jgi:hypothetical protein
MYNILKAGSFLYAAALLVFGIMHFIYVDFSYLYCTRRGFTAAFMDLPAWRCIVGSRILYGT